MKPAGRPPEDPFKSLDKGILYPGEKNQNKGIKDTLKFCPYCKAQRGGTETVCQSCGMPFDQGAPADTGIIPQSTPNQEKVTNPYTPEKGYNARLSSTYFDSKTGQFFKKADEHPSQISDIDDEERRKEHVPGKEEGDKYQPSPRVTPFKSREFSPGSGFSPATAVDTEWEERDFGGEMKSLEMPSKRPRNVDYKDIKRTQDCLGIDG